MNNNNITDLQVYAENEQLDGLIGVGVVFPSS